MHPREAIGILLAVLGALMLVAGLRLAMAFFTGIYAGAFLATCGALMMVGGALVGRLPAPERLDVPEPR